MRVPRQPLDNHCRGNPFQKITCQIDILLLFKTSKLTAPVKGFEAGAFHHVKQMQLNAVDAEVMDGRSGVQHVRSGFMGQSQNDVCTYFDAAVFGFFHGIDKALDIMSSVDQGQRFVAGRLQPVFDPDQAPLCVVLEKIQNRFIHAVGSGAHREADNIFYAQSLIVKAF